MKALIETQQPIEKAILVAVQLPDMAEWEVTYSLDELEALADTAGIQTLETCTQVRHTLEAATFIGKGKVEEIKGIAEALQADLLIFDTELSPAQIRNIEKMTGKPTLDRTDLILIIFAKRAKTKEAKLQVELAQLKYSLPRLKRLWSHLERQVGGVGVRGGPGEKQIEVDRRLVRRRIDKLERELRTIVKQRYLRGIKRSDCFTIALIGYTNVGKSTLFNHLTQAETFVEDRLFATLDSTIRKTHLNKQVDALMIDTVGFIRKLPHHLVASFRSTLEEACHADLLLHVVDLSSPILEEQVAAVEEVLSQLEIQEKSTIFVLNKCDCIMPVDPPSIWDLIPCEVPYVTVSALTGENMDLLKELIVETITHCFEEATFVLPIHFTKLVAELHTISHVISKEYLGDDQVKIHCRAPRHALERFKKQVMPEAVL